MLKFREVNETEEVREEKEKRVIVESKLSKLVKERKGELEMREEFLDKPVVKEIKENEGELKMKDYLGYLVENKNVELEEFEKEFLDLEKIRFSEKVPIEDLKKFNEYGEHVVKDNGYIEIADEMVFEGMKANNITFKVYKEGDTYGSLIKRISGNKNYRNAYNVVISNVMRIFKKSQAELKEMLTA